MVGLSDLISSQSIRQHSNLVYVSRVGTWIYGVAHVELESYIISIYTLDGQRPSLETACECSMQRYFVIIAVIDISEIFHCYSK